MPTNELFLYGTIGPHAGQVSDRAFLATLERFGGEDFTMRVNSPGGYVTDGQAMLAALDQYPGKVTAHVDSVAGSAAQLLLMSADRVEMAAGSFQMIHNSYAEAAGNAQNIIGEATRTAKFLDHIDQNAAERIAKRSGMSQRKVKAAMAEETWFEASEAVEAGLADAVTHRMAAAACGDLSIFKNAPQMLQSKPVVDASDDLRIRHFRLKERKLLLRP